MSNTPDMQNSAFDDAIRRSLEDFEAGDFNPGDWDKMEDRLQQMQPAPATGNPGSRFSGRQLGFAAAMVVATALNILLYTQNNNNHSAGEPAGLPALTANDPSNSATGTAASQTTSPQGAATKTNSPVSAASASATPAETGAKLQAEELQALQPAAAPDRTAAEGALSSRPVVTGNPAAKQVTSLVKQKAAIKSTGKTYVSSPAASKPAGWKGTTLPAAATLAGGSSGGAAIASGCAGNSLPEIVYAIRGNDTIRDFNFTVAACELLTFRVITKDKNENDKITLVSNVTRILPDAAMSLSNANNPTADFRWIAAPDFVRAEPYTFTMLVSDDRCATAGSNAYTFTVRVMPSQHVKVTAATRELEKGEGTTLQVTGAGPKARYTWLTNDGSLSDVHSASPQARPLVTTTYKVKVTNMAGCTITDSVTIQVKQTPVALADAKASVPNIFTPNGDGHNETFVVPNLEPGTFKLEVYDRWGRLVYSKEKYDNSWDARDLKSDTYFYLIKSAATGQALKGWVEVSR